MNDPSRVGVTGPLAVFAAGYRAELESRGYSAGSMALHLQLAAQVSRWLEGQGLGVGDLTPERVETFFAWRRSTVRALFVSPRALTVLLFHLRDVGVLAPPPTPEPSETDQLLQRYATYLRGERGLVEGTIRRYVDVAGRFLKDVGGQPGAVELSAVTAQAAVAFVRSECQDHTVGWGRAVVVSLRSFLRFLFLEDLIAQPLAQAVPGVAGPAETVPAGLTPQELTALLAACDRTTVAGRRDHAVLLLLAGLGLRAGEVAALEVDDVDWRQGQVRIRGKGGRIDVLPLPAAVGHALAAYLRHGRPPVGQGVLFRRIGAPHGPLAAASVTGIVYRACDRAGVRRVGAHRLRHTAATRMLAGGASLVEIAQVLRHASPVTTAIYAKADQQTLAALARPWPAGRS